MRSTVSKPFFVWTVTVEWTAWRRRKVRAFWPWLAPGLVVLAAAGAVPAAVALPPSARAKAAPPIPKEPRTTLVPMRVFFVLLSLLGIAFSCPWTGPPGGLGTLSVLPVRPALAPVSQPVVRGRCGGCEDSVRAGPVGRPGQEGGLRA